MADIKVDDQSTGAEAVAKDDAVTTEQPIMDTGTETGMSSDTSSQPEGESMAGEQKLDIDSSPMDSMASSDSNESPSPSSSSMSSSGSMDPMLSGVSSTMTSEQPMSMGEDKDSDMAMPAGKDAKDGSPMMDMPSPSGDNVKAFKPKTNSVGFLRLIVEILLVAAIVVLFVGIRTLSNDKTSLTNQVNNLNTTTATAQQAQDKTISAVSTLVPSLSGETPVTIDLTSSDLADQTSSFFTSAKAGDQLLVYVESNEAVIYRPSTGKLIIDAPLSYTVPSASSGSSTSKS